MKKHKTEFTDDMFNEFYISKETEDKQAAWCVWKVVGLDASTDDIQRAAELYQTTYENVMKWKRYYMNLIKE